MKKIIAVSLLAIALNFPSLMAGTVAFPKAKPVATVNIPEKWSIMEVDNGVGFESPDSVATIYLEITSAKGVDALIDENIDWLTKEQGVTIKEDTQSEAEVQFSGIKWNRISWDGNSKEWGPSVVGFCFTALESGKILTITYWITKKDADKNMKTLDQIFDSLKEL